MNLVETHSRLFFELASNWTLRICLDQIDYGEFSGDVGFYEKSSRDVIITQLILKKRLLSEIVFFDYVREQFGLSLCFQTIKHELGFRKRVVSTVENRRGKIVVGKTAQNLIFW